MGVGWVFWADGGGPLVLQALAQINRWLGLLGNRTAFALLVACSIGLEWA
jgi:hypothetical protein